MFDTLSIIVINLLYFLWFSVCLYLIVNTSHKTITNPRNSKGEICGYGAEHDKPYLLYLDISECADIEKANVQHLNYVYQTVHKHIGLIPWECHQDWSSFVIM